MAYTTEILKWHHYQIEVRYNPDPHHHVPLNGVTIAHLEIRCLSPERAALPITESGYRSVFMPGHYLEGYDSAADYVREWLDCAAQAPEWQDTLDQARQLSLF
ncbi:hypothetical protein [Paremcibacter congregatus]|uniref:hypothetical protein n=1 Tax=Paremcibacter congregatus TaxID=2043170 RepID=UPI0030EDD8C4|tara:strand:+ start:922 stop:1230 length:309 start_codon:yes stop_codon:yes gene_type:complete